MVDCFYFFRLYSNRVYKDEEQKPKMCLWNYQSCAVGNFHSLYFSVHERCARSFHSFKQQYHGGQNLPAVSVSHCWFLCIAPSHNASNNFMVSFCCQAFGKGTYLHLFLVQMNGTGFRLGTGTAWVRKRYLRLDARPIKELPSTFQSLEKSWRRCVWKSLIIAGGVAASSNGVWVTNCWSRSDEMKLGHMRAFALVQSVLIVLVGVLVATSQSAGLCVREVTT